MCSEEYQTGTLPRFVKNTLAKLEFNCLTCSQNFGYEQALTHKRLCQHPKVTCFLGCGSPA